MSLTTSFAVVSLVAMAVLGFALVTTVAQMLRQQALDDSMRTARAYVDLGVRDRVSTTEWTTEQLAGTTTTALEENLTGDANLLELRLFGRSGRPLFDSDGPATAFPDTVRSDLALRNQPTAELISQVDAASALTQVDAAGAPVRHTDSTQVSRVETVLDVYIPVRSPRGDAVTAEAAAEVMFDYSATQQATTAAVRTVAVLIAVGLLAVWLLLFRTVRRASRGLRVQASENARLALLDPLTGLPNRRLLARRLEVAVAQAAEDGDHVGLLILDIDRFKEINDSLGHDRGDLLLQQIAERLRGIVRETDTIARLGGDEFAVLLKTVRSIEDGTMFAERVLSVFADPYLVDGLMLHVDTSVGLAVLPDHARDLHALMKCADIAMYVAKAGRLGLSVYDAEGDSSSTARLILLGDLRQALDVSDQLSIHYQPKVDLSSRAIVGLEALLRWEHPTRGMILPSDFVPLAEQTGLVHLLTHRVLEMVLHQIRLWRVDGWEIQVAVNLSALNLAEPDLDTKIAAMLEEYGVPAHLLEFEITESAIIADPERAAATLGRLAALGSTIALDDFGTGNASFSQLRDMPVDTLKIDRSFILDMNDGNEVLVRVVTDLAHEFRMVAVAEGVEDPAIAERLQEIGCDVAQGYLFSRPVPADELPEILARFATDASVAPRRYVASQV